MRLDLSDDETSELRAALTRELHGLQTELAAADVRGFKAELRARINRLEGIAGRLTEPKSQRPISHEGVDDRRRERLAQPEEAEAEAEEVLARSSTSPEERVEAAAANPDTAEAIADRLRASSRPVSEDERPSAEVKKTG